MISDEELRAIARVDINKVAEDYCIVFNIPKDKAETVIGPVMTARELATELLQLREEKRNAEEARAKSWKRLPMWAQWKATDRDAVTFLYENKPEPCRGEWLAPTVAGRIIKFVGPVPDWKDTLEERP